jgi:DNA-directed RNA polymerase subunit beta
VIPERGSWIEINVTKKDSLSVRIDQSGKFSVMTLLRAMSPKFSTDQDLIQAFYEVTTEKITDSRSVSKIENKIAADDVVFPSDHERAGEIVIESGTRRSPKQSLKPFAW